MSWQEDLQELDNALASGRISADEYRRRRDEVLAGASTPTPPVEQQASQPPNSPFPPPFKWGSAPPEATQVVQGGGQPRQDADRTQVVRPGAEAPKGDAERTQFVRPVTPDPQDAGRTQVVHGNQVPQGPNSGGFPAQQPPNQAGWHDGSAPPWGGSEFPPMNMGDAWGNKQGPEVFDDSPGSGKGKVIAIVLAVVVLIGAGVGAYFLWGRGTGNNTADGGSTTTSVTTTTTTTTTTPKKVPEGPFVELTGKVSQFKTLAVQDAVTAKVPTVEEAQLLQQSGVTEVRYVVGPDSATGMTQGIWAFKSKDPATTLTTIDGLYQSAGFEQLPSSPKGVVIRHLPVTATNATGIYRAHYISTDFVVRVEAYGPDDAAANAAVQALIERQLAKFPAG